MGVRSYRVEGAQGHTAIDGMASLTHAAGVSGHVGYDHSITMTLIDQT
jgi:hypothetical protein